MSTIGIMGLILLAMIVVVAVWVIIDSRKKRWYKVYLANNEVLLLYRDFKERWRTNDRYLRFKDEHGKEITFPSNAHWVLMWEAVADNEINVVRDEINRMKEVMKDA